MPPVVKRYGRRLEDGARRVGQVRQPSNRISLQVFDALECGSGSVVTRGPTRVFRRYLDHATDRLLLELVLQDMTTAHTTSSARPGSAGTAQM